MYITIIYNCEVIGVFLFIDKHKISEFKLENTKHTKVTKYKHSTSSIFNVNMNMTNSQLSKYIKYFALVIIAE